MYRISRGASGGTARASPGRSGISPTRGTYRSRHSRCREWYVARALAARCPRRAAPGPPGRTAIRSRGPRLARGGTAPIADEGEKRPERERRGREGDRERGRDLLGEGPRPSRSRARSLRALDPAYSPLLTAALLGGIHGCMSDGRRRRKKARERERRGRESLCCVERERERRGRERGIGREREREREREGERER